jgi:predicted nucleotidyltransferase
MSLNALCVRLLDEGLAPEAGSPVRRTAGVEPGLLDAVERSWAGELVGVALFGSAARGDATAASDVDLLVVLEPGTRIERSLYDRWDEIVTSGGRRDDRRVSPQFVALPASARDAGGIWLEVAREGIVLGDRDRRLARFLIELRDLVAEGAFSRKIAHGHPYWVREGRPR